MPIHCCEAVEFLLRDTEARVRHSERLEEAFCQERAERLTRCHFDHSGSNIDADAVVPSGAGLERKRDTGEYVAELLQRARRVVHELDVAVHLTHREVDEEVVGQAARVHEQVTDLHRGGLVGERAVGLEHLRGGEGRDELGDRVDEADFALLDEEHERSADDGLGHRVDAKDGVLLHRLVVLAITLAVAVRERGLAATVDADVDADERATVDVGLHDRVDALQTR